MDALLGSKTGQLTLALMALVALVVVLMVVAAGLERLRGRVRSLGTLAVFVGPALLLLGVGLIYPALRTIMMSFYDGQTENFVGLSNYIWMFTHDDTLRSFLNTFAWVLLVPTLSTAIGLVYAILVDGKRFEKTAKSLLFMPMAISFVGAGIIWKFVYDFRGAAQEQIGLLNAMITGLGFDPVRFLQDAPMNTVYLLVVMIWIQAGFAMVLLSAAIKAIPSDIVEAARLDGVSPWQMFRSITVPSIQPTLVVVATTITIATLKVFDITRTMTGARFDTQVLANQMYDYSFTFGNNGYGSALAVAIFVLVIPIVVYNSRQMVRNREVRGG